LGQGRHGARGSHLRAPFVGGRCRLAGFPFPREFQRAILRLILCDREAFLSTRAALDPAYFTDEAYRWVAQASFKVYDDTGEVPSQPSVLQVAMEDCPGGLDPDEVAVEVRALYEDGKPADSKHVRAKMTTFARHQRLRSRPSRRPTWSRIPTGLMNLTTPPILTIGWARLTRCTGSPRQRGSSPSTST